MNTVSLNDWQCFSDRKGNASGFGLSKFVTDSLLNEIKPLTQFNIIWFKSVCGFGTAVLSQPMTRKPPPRLQHHTPQTNEKRAVLLIANKKPNTNQRGKKGVNRKRVTMSDSYKGYEVNAKKSGLYAEMLSKSVRLIEETQQRFGRVLMVRFDLHQQSATDNSERLSKFFKNLIRWAKKHYETDYVGYYWTREQERAKHQHYHVYVLIDGDKCRTGTRVWEKAKDYWLDPRGGYHVTKPKHKMINTADSLADAVHWASYLAKARGKGYRPPQAKDYGASRLPINRSTTQET